MCYLCLADQFRLEMPKSKTERLKDRALEIKQLLRQAEQNSVCGEGNKVIQILKEEQYKLARSI
jgi:hypothetical protein